RRTLVWSTAISWPSLPAGQSFSFRLHAVRAKKERTATRGRSMDPLRSEQKKGAGNGSFKFLHNLSSISRRRPSKPGDPRRIGHDLVDDRWGRLRASREWGKFYIGWGIL